MSTERHRHKKERLRIEELSQLEVVVRDIPDPPMQREKIPVERLAADKFDEGINSI